MRSHDHWMRHMARVPKGYLRYHVLNALNTKAMSGSEIMTEIENQTNGFWRPSPGSIYPLLAWLLDSGHIKELSAGDTGMKRYELTEAGRALFEQHKAIVTEQECSDEDAKSRPPFDWGFQRPPRDFMMGPRFFLPPHKGREMRRSMRNVMTAAIRLAKNLEIHFTDEALDKGVKILNDAADKLNQLTSQIQGTPAEQP